MTRLFDCCTICRWVNETRRQARSYLGALNTYKHYIQSGKEAVVVTYERLADPTTRVEELTKIVSFLGTGWAVEDIECAFESPQTMKSLRGRDGEFAEQAATIRDAYPVWLACDLWRTSLQYSKALGEQLKVDLSGYGVINGYKCFDRDKDSPPTHSEQRRLTSLRPPGSVQEVTKNAPKKPNRNQKPKRAPRGGENAEKLRTPSKKSAQATAPATSISGVTPYRLSYNLTAKAQSVLDTFVQHQNPEDCASAKYLIFKPGGSGFGSQLHIFATQACTAMSVGRILVPLTRIAKTNWLWNDPEFCRTNPGPECYFERISTCDEYVRKNWSPTQNARDDAYNDWSAENQFVYSEGGPWVPEMKGRTNAGVDYCRSTFGRSDWKVPLVATMTQPNAKLRQWLEDGVNEFLRSPLVAKQPSIRRWPPTNNLISVAIRWGDKIVDSDLHAISRYVNGVQEIVRRRNIQNPVVFVTSEDETAVQAFHAATADLPWTVLHHAHTRCFQEESHEVYDYSRLQDVANEHDVEEAIISAQGENFQGKYKLFAGRGWSHCLSKRNSLNLPETPRVALMSLLNAYIAAEAKHTVYTSSSNWGRFILETKLSREGGGGIVIDLDAKANGGQKGSHNRQHLL